MTETSPALAFALHVERCYQSLMQSTAPHAPSLGGKLFYAGPLDAEGRALLVAANIAGAASLAVTADAAAQKQAVRDGVIDFLVTSLDEALRILKNELRKHETVAVCIAAAPETIQAELRERGVVPDLLRTAPPAALDSPLLWWQVAAAPAQWLPRLDKIALECLAEAAGPDLDCAQRWLRQSPRYLGRMASGLRILRCDAALARNLVSKVEAAVHAATIAVPVEMHLGTAPGAGEEIFRFSPTPADAR